MTNKHFLKRIIGFGLIIDILILDQLTKWLVLEYAIRPNINGAGEPLGLFAWFGETARLPFTSIEITPFFNLVMVWNQGISFGLFQSETPYILIGLALAISALFAFWLSKATGWVQAIALGLVIGGALGNVIDRFRFGAVADFFDFHAFGWHYPAFNIADSCIVIGIALLLYDGLFLEPKRQKTSDEKLK